MLIYNFQKEFVGIDEADLEVFGFANLSELKAESSDFADMFVRTPGYIHNFKHVHWIDFVTCADPSEQSKVIIEVNSKTYKANIEIDTVYLSDNPTSKAYLINLNNLRGLTLKENGEFSEDIARKKPPRIEPSVGHAFNISKEDEEALEYEAAPELEGFKPFENIEDVEDVEEEIQEIKPTAPLDISFDDDDIDDSVFSRDEEEPVAQEPVTVEDVAISVDTDLSLDSLEMDVVDFEEVDKETETVQVEEDDGFDYSYNYDPQVASDELGLPIDLIEEFIQDFIAQAKEFKDELYTSLDDGDTDNVKILSHKLKGVAANLRIEDAFNTLSIINTSSDISEVGKYLNIFYKIIAKLSGEEIQAAKPAVPKPAEAKPEEIKPLEVEEDDLILDFKADENIDEPQEVNQEILTEDEDDLILDFKEDEVKPETTNKIEETEDDLYLDIDLDIKDSEVPKKIEIPELADDTFLDEETVDIDDLLSIGSETEDDELKVEIEAEELPDIEYSKELVANEIGLDQESFDEIFEDYIQDSRSSTDTIQKAISNDDFSKCRKETLKLKGMSDNMRIHSFKEELTTLINSSDKDELIKAVKKIDAIIAQISK